MAGLAVVIAASNLTPALRDRLASEGELLTFADTEPIQALQAILEHRPRLIVLERLFAATPRGAALINRIRTDAQLARAEVRVMSHTGDYVRQVSKPAEDDGASVAEPEAVAARGDDSTETRATSTTPTATAEAPRPLDWHGTRRAPRYR